MMAAALASSLALASGEARADFGDLPFPLPCGAECFQAAMDAAAGCKEGGGDIATCAKAFLDALTACRAEAGCEAPEHPPICGEECLSAARTAAAACREAGGDVAACLAAVKTELRTCIEAAGCEIPDPPGGAIRCGLECLKSSLGTARECLEGGGSFRDCAGAFRAAFEECRASSECGQPEEPPPPPEEDAVLLPLLLEDPFIRGDMNRDGAVDISDPVGILGFLFLGTAPPACQDAADATDDGEVDIADPVFILLRLFQDASGSLPQPYPGPGFDATEDAFVCGVPGS
jgi:hypothetical protein